MSLALSSLRVRLLALVLLALLPALGLVLYTGLETHRLEADRATSEAQRVALLAASQQETFVEGARQLLIALAQVPELRNGDRQVCSDFMAGLLPRFPPYANLGVIEPNGDVNCSGLPLTAVVSAADRGYFPRALASQDFAMGEYQIGRVTGRASINFAYPVNSGGGELQGIAFAALDLAWIDQLAQTLDLPEGASFTVIDKAGTILARYPDSGRWVGQTLPETPIVSAMLERGEGTATASSACMPLPPSAGTTAQGPMSPSASRPVWSMPKPTGPCSPIWPGWA